MKHDKTKIAAGDIFTKEKSGEKILELVCDAMNKARETVKKGVRVRLDDSLFAAFETVKVRGVLVARDSFSRLYERNLELYRKRIPKSLFTRTHAQRWAATQSVRGCFRAYWETYLDECRRIFEEQLNDLFVVSEGSAYWEWGTRKAWESIDRKPPRLVDRQRSEEEEKLKYLVWGRDSRVRSKSLEAKDKPKASKGVASVRRKVRPVSRR